MPKTFTTTVAPIPTDARVLHLEQLLSVSRSQAVGVVVMSWAWMIAEESEGVVPLPVKILDNVVDIEGAGQALVDAGLVGLEPGGLILPLGVRQAADRATRKGESKDERRKRQQNERQETCRKRQRLNKPSKASGPKAILPTAEAPAPRQMSRRLGTVGIYDIMLLYRKDGVPFYKLAGAAPREFTGTVSDPENPSLQDAFKALLQAMKRACDLDRLDHGANFRPSMEEMVVAAKADRDRRLAAEADAARREQANQSLAEASAEDQDDHDHGGQERDAVTPMSRSERDTVTCHAPVTVDGFQAVAESPCDDRHLDAISEGSKCHAPCHNAAPSSSSSSVCIPSGEEDSKKNTTTTSSVPIRERDTDDIFDRFLPVRRGKDTPASDDAERERRQGEKERLAALFADALGTDKNSILRQWRSAPDILVTRLVHAGIDPNTGLLVNADGPDRPVGARGDIDTTTDTMTGNKPAAGSVKAPGKDSGFRQSTEALNRLGITRTVNHAPPPDEDQEAFEDKRRRIADQLLRQGA
jgi:hypothetical protein